jgi:hypothetical protein
VVELPENAVTQETLVQWYLACDELARAKKAELLLRLKIFKHHFPTPVEGTNTIVLPDSYQLKATHKISRKVDEPALIALAPELEKAEVPVADLIKREPELVLSEYRKLEGDKLHLFDRCLIIKPGETPGLEIVPPSTRGKKK